MAVERNLIDNMRLHLYPFVLLMLAFPARAFSQTAEGPEQDLSDKDEALVLVVSMQACSDGALPEAEAKTADEFKALGFSTEVVDCEALSQAEGTLDVFRALEEMAEEKGAVCAISILRSAEEATGGVDIWIADLVTKKTTFKHWIHAWGEEAEAQIVALKTVEMLEVSFLELALPESKESHPAPPEPVARMVETAKAEIQPPPAPSPPEPPEPKLESTMPIREKPSGYLGLRFGAGVFGSTLGLGAMAGLQVALRWNALPALALEAEGLIQPAGKDSVQDSLDITFSMAAARLWLFWEPVRLKWLRLGFGAGGGILISWASAASPLFEGIRRDITQTGYVGGSLQAAFIVLKNLWIRLGFTAGTSVPRIRIIFNEEQVVSYGMPLLEGFLGLELRLP